MLLSASITLIKRPYSRCSFLLSSATHTHTHTQIQKQTHRYRYRHRHTDRDTEAQRQHNTAQQHAFAHSTSLNLIPSLFQCRSGTVVTLYLSCRDWPTANAVVLQTPASNIQTTAKATRQRERKKQVKQTKKQTKKKQKKNKQTNKRTGIITTHTHVLAITCATRPALMSACVTSVAFVLKEVHLECKLRVAWAEPELLLLPPPPLCCLRADGCCCDLNVCIARVREG